MNTTDVLLFAAALASATGCTTGNRPLLPDDGAFTEDFGESYLQARDQVQVDLDALAQMMIFKDTRTA
jgi:hypothetical protein